MTQFRETYRPKGKLLTKDELQFMLCRSLELQHYGSGSSTIEALKSNLAALTKAFAKLIVSKAVVGDHTAIRILTDNVYDVEVEDDH